MARRSLALGRALPGILGKPADYQPCVVGKGQLAMIEARLSRLRPQLSAKTHIPFKDRLASRHPEAAMVAAQPITRRPNRVSWPVVMSPNVLPRDVGAEASIA